MDINEIQTHNDNAPVIKLYLLGTGLAVLSMAVGWSLSALYINSYIIPALCLI